MNSNLKIERQLELVFQHLNFADIMNLSQTSKTLNEEIGNSTNCMKKVHLKLIERKEIDHQRHVDCFKNSNRKYQNVFINCRDNSEASERFMKILKATERSVVELSVENSAYRWDLCNTLKFEDQMIVLTVLKSLRITSSNDHLAEILLISCTYLDTLIVDRIKLCKYFHYCLRVNEKLKTLKILNPRIIYDGSVYDNFNFKLDNFEFRSNSHQDIIQIDFLRKIVMPLVTGQLMFLSSMTLENVSLSNLMNLITNNDFPNPNCLRLIISDEILTFETGSLKLSCNGFTCLNHFYDALRIFLSNKCDNLESVTVTGIDDQAALDLIFTKIKLLKDLTIGSGDESFDFKSEKITQIETTATNLEQINFIFQMAPNAKSLRVFEVTEELLASASKSLVKLQEVEYHFIHPKCFSKVIKFTKITSLDPLMRIPDELHDLIIQHLSSCDFVDHLTKTWTKFGFSDNL